MVLANTQDSSTHQPLALVTRTPLRQYGASNSGALSGAFNLKVPRPSFVTAADRVSGQLVRLLGSDLQATFAVLGELPELSKRLSHSPILLNCVTLYCHAWSQCADLQLRFHQLLQTASTQRRSRVCNVPCRVRRYIHSRHSPQWSLWNSFFASATWSRHRICDHIDSPSVMWSRRWECRI